MKIKIYLFAALTLCAGMTQAGEYCLLDGTEMFSCTFNGGAKAVELCDAVWEAGGGPFTPHRSLCPICTAHKIGAGHPYPAPKQKLPRRRHKAHPASSGYLKWNTNN